MTSTVTCGYTGAAWENNSADQNACQIYAALAAQCNSAFTIGDCQSSIEENWWLDVAQWAGNETTFTFDATGIPSSVATSSINIPSWALLTNTGRSWDPSIASAVAVIVSGANTNVDIGTAAPTVTGDHNGFTFSYNPYTDTGNDDPYYFNPYYSTGVAGYAVALGILFGSYALLGIAVGIVY